MFMALVRFDRQSIEIKLMQVYSRYPCEKPLMERVFVRMG